MATLNLDNRHMEPTPGNDPRPAFWLLLGVLLVLSVLVLVVDSCSDGLLDARAVRKPAHSHEVMPYKMIGRFYADTLCRTDTMLYRDGRHRPVPEVLREVALFQIKEPQPIIEKPDGHEPAQ